VTISAATTTATMSAATYRSRQTEKQFMAAVKDAAEKLGWLVWHFPNAIINPCVPDLFLIRDGVLLLAELKTERGKLSARQVAMLLDLDAHGIHCYVWRPSDWDEIEASLTTGV
jgi:hypothetical protein